MELVDPKIGTVLPGGYRLLGRLGAGGMGVVYRAVRESDGRVVAVKLLHEGFLGERQLVERFDREVKAMRRLEHVRLVEILDAGHAPSGAPFLVMEHVDGRALSVLLDGGAVEPRRALRLMAQILDGVGAAHAVAVVHRDLKPDNVLLVGSGDDESVKVLDFGLAKIAQGESATGLTHTGLALGTPSYMAPEQGLGGTIDHRADLYALGVILYQMIVGRKPFQADSPIAILRMHMDDTPPRPSRVGARLSSSLENAILRAMEKDPAKRFEDAAAFAHALANTAEHRGLPIGNENVAGEPTQVGKRNNTPKPASEPSALLLSSSALVEESAAKPVTRGRLLRVVLAAAAVCVCAIAWSRLSARDQRTLTTVATVAVDRTKQTAQHGYDRVTEWAEREDAKRKTSQSPSPSPSPSPDLAVAPSPPDLASAPVVAEPEDEEEDDDDTEPVAPTTTPGAQLEAAAPSPPPTAPPRKETLDDAKKLIAAGKIDEAVQTLYRLRRASPKSAAIAMWLGHAYFRKLWRTDGLREYGAALAASPALKRDALLLRNVVVGLEDPTFRLARSIIKKHIGNAALPELRSVARTAPSPRLRARAVALGQKLAHPRRR